MVQAPIPANDEERLCALRAYDLLDRDAEPAFDTIVRIAADVCDVEISVIALIDRDRQYFYARNGMEPQQTPRAIAFCAHAILEPGATFEIPDATKDPRFADNPLVTGDIGVRFYAAQPLTTPDGLAIGGLCLIGKQPKTLSGMQRRTLQGLGKTVMDMFEARKLARANESLLVDAKDTALAALNKLQERRAALTAKNEHFLAALDNMTQGLCMYDADQRLIVCNKRYAELHQLPPELTLPGTRLSQIVQHRIENGVYTGQGPEAYMRERAEWGSNPNEESTIHEFCNGRAIAIVRRPLPGGGWVATHDDITARKYAEKALQESERHFRNLVEGSLQGVFIARNWKLLFANQALANIFGYDCPEEILALDEVAPLLAPEERPRIWDYKTARERDAYAPEVYEARGLRKDGSEFWVEFRVRKVDWRGSEAMQCVVLDVDNRKKAEAELCEQRTVLRIQNEHFHAALENMTQGLCMFDAGQRLIVCNKRYAEMHGLPPELVRPGTRLAEIVRHRNDSGVFSGDAARTYAEERRQWGENPTPETRTYELVDGRSIYVARTPLPGGGWVSTHEDITTLRRAQDELSDLNVKLAAEEERFRKLYRNTPAMMHSIDESGAVIDASEHWFDVMGYPREEVIGRKSIEFLTEESRQFAIDKVLPDFWRNGSCGNVPYKMVKKDGTIIDVKLSAIVDNGSGGEPRRSLACVIDVTDQVRAERELIEHRDHLQELVNGATADLKAKAQELEAALAREKELNELQRQFVSMASHEFRTPLAIIDSTAQRLKKNAGNLSPGEVLKRIEKIRGAVERMTRLMESTLTAARLEEGKVVADFRSCDIGQIVSEVCMRHQDLTASHVISCELRELPAAIRADAHALDQVLTNLLSNAVKYSPDAPDIRVSAFGDGDHVVIQVKDHGLGIDAEDVPRLFGRFFRAKTSSGIVGTGIGLNLVKTLVEMHGGAISVESRKDEGSIFTIRLPATGPAQGEKAA